MTDNEDIDLEREKTESYELGHISQLEDTAEDLRKRAGELYAHSDSHTDTKTAKFLKNLAQDYEQQAEERRANWEDKYKND